MKAKDWKFTKRVSDGEDITASLVAGKAYFSLPAIEDVNAVEAFYAGFNRGQAWSEAKDKE